ncbi:MAG: L-threonylcarbamoyladenylate synthase [Lagierella massiliensis]|nr:L-threonylcarbamoyladenylate synthase [Lagierella massiliensis]
MNTKIINEREIDVVKYASDLIKSDELVAIPTETVYGLGGNGLSDKACKKIFKAKNRPSDNPLILHISEMDDIYRLVESIDPEIRRALEFYWPGPLTIILNKSDIIPDTVTAGGETVAIRMPGTKITRDIIKASKVPIAAPSANISGRPSPTTALDVFKDMDGKIPLIVDGGNSNVGIESTVLDCTCKPRLILRPGFYSKEDLEIHFGEVHYDRSIIKEGEIPKSPGQKYKHYAPKGKMKLVLGNKYSVRDYFKEMAKKCKDKKVALISFEDNRNFSKEFYRFYSLGNRDNLLEMASLIFRILRQCDDENIEYILCEGVEEVNLGIGIMNRLKKSSSGNFIHV